MTSTVADPVLRLLRFDGVQRLVHWINAVLFGVLMFTGIPLYFGSFFGILFARHQIQEIHLWSGLLLPVPILLSLVGPWGRRMRHDLHRFAYWSSGEVRWLRSLGREKTELDKFNPGQKANALFVGAAVIVLWATGYVLQWFRFFPVSWREGATVTHDFFAFAVFAVVIGHVAMALTHREAMSSMIKGSVSREWAERHAREWVDERESDQ
jgi:formate dehydrogenase subunit gamma